MRLYQKCKLLLLLPDYMQPTNCCCYSKIVPKMHTTNWCCYCKIILMSQMQSANCCCYCKTRWKMLTATAIARWYHKCILQIDAVLARLYQKCLLQIAAFTKCCCHCEAYWKLISKFKKYFESQCQLNSIYSLLSARPFDKRTETASVQQYFQFLRCKILILI